MINDNRAVLKTCLIFTFLAFALTVAPVLFEPNVEAEGGESVKRASHAASQKTGILTPAATGSITGTITDAATLAPLQNIEVRVYDSGANQVAVTFTNSLGFYGTPNILATGTYYAVTVNSSGYIDELYNNTNCILLNCNPTTGTPINVTNGAVTPGIDFALAKGARVSGTVTDAATSLPLANVAVFISSATGQGVSTAFTDSSGNYLSGTGLPSGTYYAVTSNTQGYINEFYDNIVCFGCDVTVGTPIPLTAGATTAGINFALDIGGRFSGIVTDAVTLAPIENVSVVIFNSSGISVSSGLTDAKGRYITLEGVPTGTYYARTFSFSSHMDELYEELPCDKFTDPTAGTPIAVTAGAVTPEIDFTLSPAGGITGMVTDASTALPLPNIGVDIFNSQGNIVDSVLTDGSGNYSTNVGLATGVYYARTFNFMGYLDVLYKNLACPTPCDVTSGTEIFVTAGETVSEINFALAPGGRISGNVRDMVTSAPIEDVFVGIFDSSGQLVIFPLTDASGNYITGEGLPTGTYFVRTFSPLGYVNELYNDIQCLNCQIFSGTPVAVTEGATTSGINFGLQLGGRISGSVTNAVSAGPLQAVSVRIYNQGGTHVASSVTNELGVYTTTGLPAGTYFARTLSNLGFVDTLYNNISCADCNPTVGTGIPVAVGQIAPSINLALCQSPSFSEQGHIFESGGGEVSFTVTSQGGCGWIAASEASWIELTSNPISQGNGRVSYVVRDNPGSEPRTGTIRVANVRYTVTQQGRPAPLCAFTLSPQFEVFSASGGAGSINVTTGAGCAWKAESNKSWLVVTSSCCGVGSGSVSYLVEANATGGGRSGVITVNGQKLNVKQQ